MKARFVCKKHELYLDGHPQWLMIQGSDPEEFEVSFMHMRCIHEIPTETQECSEKDWTIEVISDTNGS